MIHLLTDSSSHEVGAEPTGDGQQAPEAPNSFSEVIDVTIPVQCLVKDSRLELLEASKVCALCLYQPTLKGTVCLLLCFCSHCFYFK